MSHIPAIEHANRFDLIVGEQVDHLEDVVEIIVGLNLLIVFERTPIAAFVDPRHDVHRHGHVGKRTDVLLYRDWVDQFQQAVDSHCRLIINKSSSERNSCPVNIPKINIIAKLDSNTAFGERFVDIWRRFES